MTQKDKLNSLRAEMRSEGIDLYIIPMRNNFLDNDLNPSERRIKYISNFTGSAGQILITLFTASIFVDGRYTLQAKQQVDKKVYEINDLGIDSSINWIIKNLEKNCVVGYDPALFSIAEIKYYEKKLEKSQVKLKSIPDNLVDKIWAKNSSQKNIIISDHKTIYAGSTRYEKLNGLRNKFLKNDTEVLFIGDNNFISWLTNLRAYKRKFTPVIRALCLVTTKCCHLFIDNSQINKKDITKINDEIEIYDIKSFSTNIASILTNKILVKLDEKNTNKLVHELLMKQNMQIIHQPDITHNKAIKNTTELTSFSRAHDLDALAVCNFLHWIKNQNNLHDIDELAVVHYLEVFRGKQKPNYLGPSFPAIVGFNENGAIIHYSATKKTNKRISGDGLLLIDSGGQYKYGTTDVTRTILIGKATKKMKELYTIVLKAHITLARKSFNKNTTGAELDDAARGVIKKYGYDYNHGTGHGVGSVLSVHDGILSISPKEKKANFQENMVFSNEPGIYIEGLYGIRIENLMLVRKDKKVKNNLYFEILSHIPFERQLLDLSILDGGELNWINNYHSKVYNKLGPKLGESARNWLRDITKPI